MKRKADEINLNFLSCKKDVEWNKLITIVEVR